MTDDALRLLHQSLTVPIAHSSSKIRALSQKEPDKNFVLKIFARSLQLNSELGLRLFKGGDPAAGSPTATLLRLHPNYQPYRRQLPPRQ